MGWCIRRNRASVGYQRSTATNVLVLAWIRGSKMRLFSGSMSRNRASVRLPAFHCNKRFGVSGGFAGAKCDSVSRLHEPNRASVRLPAFHCNKRFGVSGGSREQNATPRLMDRAKDFEIFTCRLDSGLE